MSSSPPWICPTTRCGLSFGNRVTVWSTVITCVPDVDDQAAFCVPFISRNSDRG